MGQLETCQSSPEICEATSIILPVRIHHSARGEQLDNTQTNTGLSIRLGQQHTLGTI